MSEAAPTRKLTAAVVQHALTGRVLMLGYMDDEALAKTRESGEVWFWSRSRQRLWKKGETSGNVLKLVDLKADCDADAWLVRALPAGPTCHTGSQTCFGTDGKEPAPTELEALYQTIVARKNAPAGTKSYVRQLLEENRVGQKIGEEANELAAEIPSGSKERVIAEAADLFFHALVGLAARDVTLEEVARELHRRAGVSGIDEKAARKKWSSVGDILGPGGVLARAIPGYETRPSQVQMAERVADALARRRPLLVEAGTGTGKTLAYLVPAIESGLKVIVSTGTKNLQEQIFKKDIPLLQEHLGRPFTAACMKGISNYLCLRRFHEHVARQASLSMDGNLESTLDAIRVWSGSTEAGDRAELPDLADDSPAWRDVSPTQETRLGQRCKYFERCFVTQARRRAYSADVVIVIYHLFFADLALREKWPDVQLLPPYEAVIFDEAHGLEDVATDYFGVGVSSLRLMAIVRDVGRAIAQGNAPDKLSTTNAHVDLRADQMFDALRRRAAAKGGDRISVDGATWAGEPEKSAHALDVALEELEAALGAVREGELTDGGNEAGALKRRARAIRDDLALLVDGAQKYDRRHVFWAETRGRTVLLHASPVDISEIFREKLLGSVDAAVFTSATLTAAGSFEFVRARLGLESAMEERLASPFDFARQALLYVPKDLPEPNDPAFVAAAAARMHELVRITDGRAFLLFTSHRMMQKVHAILAPKLTQPVLLQGDKPKHLLVEEFKRRVGSVLFATASFWEGVDVVGEALSLVVIDKLPFSPPDDPLVAARAGLLEDAGQDAFVHYHVPRAALALAQGFGRLIRHRSDRGVVALLDKRAVTKPYGRRVLAGLPADCPRTPLLDDVRTFWTRQTQLPLVG